MKIFKTKPIAQEFYSEKISIGTAKLLSMMFPKKVFIVARYINPTFDMKRYIVSEQPTVIFNANVVCEYWGGKLYYSNRN